MRDTPAARWWHTWDTGLSVVTKALVRIQLFQSRRQKVAWAQGGGTCWVRVTFPQGQRRERRCYGTTGRARRA
ncbi:unnamed protein product [Prunus armeniaca]|uniref:Uncharacterized protein n=1 Tax=Prunus armeniaca TaxID=36596 RepID=A0A6J5XZI9_PRUAR|nr:unnamed protein product [Prunus armeniaca]